MAPNFSKCLAAAKICSFTFSSIPSPKYSLGKAIFIPLISWPILLVKSGTATFDDVLSFLSKPEITFKS